MIDPLFDFLQRKRSRECDATTRRLSCTSPKVALLLLQRTYGQAYVPSSVLMVLHERGLLEGQRFRFKIPIKNRDALPRIRMCLERRLDLTLLQTLDISVPYGLHVSMSSHLGDHATWIPSMVSLTAFTLKVYHSELPPSLFESLAALPSLQSLVLVGQTENPRRDIGPARLTGLTRLHLTLQSTCTLLPPLEFARLADVSLCTWEKWPSDLLTVLTPCMQLTRLRISGRFETDILAPLASLRELKKLEIENSYSHYIPDNYLASAPSLTSTLTHLQINNCVSHSPMSLDLPLPTGAALATFSQCG